MFIVVYRWRCRPEHEAAFRVAWAEMTFAIREQCGSLGSRLHRADDGELAEVASHAAVRFRAILAGCARRAASIQLDCFVAPLLAMTAGELMRRCRGRRP